MNKVSIRGLCIKSNLARQKLLEITTKVGIGHLGGSLSCIDILTALYFRVMRHDPKNINWEKRDRFILSKGHAAPALYVIMSMVGYIPITELETLAKIDSRLQGHPDCKKLPGIEISTGSLGQGFSVAVGMALGYRYDKKNNSQIYCLLGDGECDEGQIWEAAMFAANYDLKNITVIIDRNGFQIDGKTEEVIRLEPFSQKWQSFNWEVLELDGHNMDEIVKYLENSRNKRVVIIAKTVKGKGISFMENNNTYHAKYCDEIECEKALNELKNDLLKI
jgi:transketolase